MIRRRVGRLAIAALACLAVLGGRERGLVVVYARATGPVENPAIEHLPVKTINRQLFGIFRNLLELPEAIRGAEEDYPPETGEEPRRKQRGAS